MKEAKVNSKNIILGRYMLKLEQGKNLYCLSL
jgi:hypothetical protein